MYHIQSSQLWRNVGDRAHEAKPAEQVKNIVSTELSQLYIWRVEMICAMIKAFKTWPIKKKLVTLLPAG